MRKNRKESASKKCLWAYLDLVDFRDKPFTLQTLAAMNAFLCSRLRVEVAQAAQALSRDVDPEEWKHRCSHANIAWGSYEVHDFF